MADNVAITAGSGTSIAADDISSVFYQRVKIAAGADGAAADVPGDGAAGLATGGSVAHDSADSGNPIKIGAKAMTANPTAVAGGDRTNIYADDVGRLLVRVGQPRDLVTQAYVQILNSTFETTILGAGGAGVFHDLTALTISNDSTTTGVTVTVRDATAGSAVLIFQLAARAMQHLVWHVPLKQTTANNNWTIQLSVNTVTVNITTQAEVNV